MTEGGWDRPRDRARTLGEGDGNNEPIAEGDEDDDDEYSEEGDIPDDDDKYLLASTMSASLLKRAMTSAAPALACPASQRPSVPSC